MASSTKKPLVAQLKEILGTDMKDVTGEVEIVRQGDKIILPPNMSYAEGREWLKRQEEAEETKVNIHGDIIGYPLDGINALYLAFKEIFGFTDLRGNMSFFGEQPPVMVKIATGFRSDDFVQVPYCKMLPPPWEGGYLQPSVTSNDRLHISGVVKRKFEGQVKRLISRAQEIVREKSIYKGKAISIDLSYLDKMEDGDEFNPEKYAPEFMDLTGVSTNNLIFSDEIRFQLETNIFVRLTQTEACRLNNMPLKHGALLAGPYGTGK